MTRYEALKTLVQKWREEGNAASPLRCGVYKRCARELEAALALPEDRKTVNADWQPIETLPLSNYFVILCDNHGNRWLAFTDEDTKTDCGDTGYYPKYWMLAPAPPKDGE